MAATSGSSGGGAGGGGGGGSVWGASVGRSRTTAFGSMRRGSGLFLVRMLAALFVQYPRGGVGTPRSLHILASQTSEHLNRGASPVMSDELPCCVLDLVRRPAHERIDSPPVGRLKRRLLLREGPCLVLVWQTDEQLRPLVG